MKIRADSQDIFTIKVSGNQAVNLSVKQTLELFKKYWWHAGNWHEAGCYFIVSDQGVCNCPGVWGNDGYNLRTEIITELVGELSQQDTRSTKKPTKSKQKIAKNSHV